MNARHMRTIATTLLDVRRRMPTDAAASTGDSRSHLCWRLSTRLRHCVACEHSGSCTAAPHAFARQRRRVRATESVPGLRTSLRAVWSPRERAQDEIFLNVWERGARRPILNLATVASACSCRAAEAALKQQKMTRAKCGSRLRAASNGGNRDLCRPVGRKAVDARRYRREGDRAQRRAPRPARASWHRRWPAAAPRRLAALPDRADGVDDMAGLEAIAARDLGLAGLAAAERAAFGEQLRPGGAMDGAVDAAAAEQGGVGRVDDGVDVERGDVGLEDLDAVRHGCPPPRSARELKPPRTGRLRRARRWRPG